MEVFVGFDDPHAKFGLENTLISQSAQADFALVAAVSTASGKYSIKIGFGISPQKLPNA